ncbi:MAG: OmpA family protein [Bacteroidetes bacterium]|jgi:outer membrane protein OmpA-like peptidoglycan-associated protein|nr:OmpA family protein [Bacteroidota bacterium]
MGFDGREHAKRYAPQEGDTLQAIAERETEAGNPLTWQDLARFNWGTDDEAEVNAFLRDELGARKRDADNNFVLSPDDEAQGQLLIPRRFERRGLALKQTYTLRVRKRVAPPQFLECCHLPGVTFAFNSSFIRPNVVGYLKKLEAVTQRHPEAKVMIFGHTDAVGDDLYNKKLSERRAWSVYAFVTNDPDAWEVLYNHPDEDWGLAVLQEILADMNHYAGKIDGDMGSATRSAMRAFLGLPDDAPVQNDAAFRWQLFDAYMASKHDIKLAPDRFIQDGYMGCGEFNPLSSEDQIDEASRRVTFFLFHPDRLPPLPCAYADVAPCQKQMVSLDYRHTETFQCSFYDSLAQKCASEEVLTLQVRLFDAFNQFMPEAPCRVTVGQYAQELVSDADGYVEVRIGGSYPRALVEWGEAEDKEDASADAYRYQLELFLNYNEPADAHEQAMRRLYNLGYSVDLSLPFTEQPEPIRTFQLHYRDRFDLPDTTGTLDAETQAAIRDVHDACDPETEAQV